LRALYGHIDAASRRGATRQDVLDVLNADGFSMAMASFKSGAATFPGGAKRYESRMRRKRPAMSP
jgi:hypothetical protein